MYALCRVASEALQALPNTTVIEDVDVTSQASVNAAIETCPNEIDILINNAGILKRVGLDYNDEAILQDQWNVNAMGPLQVYQSLL